MSKKTKIAIVGVGRWGKNLLKEFNGQAEISYVCHKGNPETAKFLAETYPQIKTTTDLYDILADNSVSAVIVATPINTHFEIAQRVIDSGKHLFLEKPGGKSKKELEILVSRSRSKKVILAIGYVFIHHPVLAKIKELIKNEKIELVNFEWFKWGSFEGHMVQNLLPHDISIMISLGITPKTITHYKESGIITKADILEISFDADKTKINVYINRISPEKRKTVTIKTDKTSYIWNNNDLYKIDPDKKEKIQIEINNKLSPVSLEIQDFLKCIRDGSEPKANGELALEVWDVLQMIRPV